MREVMEQRLEAKRRRLTQLQEYFQIDLKNINSSTYEDNAISALLEMKKVNTEANLEMNNRSFFIYQLHMFEARTTGRKMEGSFSGFWNCFLYLSWNR